MRMMWSHGILRSSSTTHNYQTSLRSGFTLLELMVVLLLVSIMMGLIVPKLFPEENGAVKKEAIHFVNVVQWLAEKATYSGQRVRLIMDFEKQRYSCEIRDGVTFVPIEDSLVRPRMLSKSLARMDIATKEGEFSLGSQSVISIEFSSLGPENPIMVHFHAGKIPGIVVYFSPGQLQPEMVTL